MPAEVTMNSTLNVLLASIGIFAGSLVSDSMFGDGIQMDDIQQALALGLLAGFIQWRLNRSRK